MKVILFNGPASSGKDHAADLIVDEYYMETKHRRFKDRLFEITSAVYGVPLEQLTGPLYERNMKEVPHDCFKGLSTRQALIKVSEDVIKPSLGHNYFGESLADSLDSELTVVSDSGGWLAELLPVVDRAGAENILVVRVSRPGYTFEGDSRNYFKYRQLVDNGIEFVDLRNEGSLEEFEDKVLDITGDWLGSFK